MPISHCFNAIAMQQHLCSAWQLQQSTNPELSPDTSLEVIQIL